MGNICKRRKRQWVGPGQTPSPDVEPDTHQKKILLCVFRDIEGVVHWKLNARTTLTTALYSQQLEKVVVALRQKRPLKSKATLLMENARPHVAHSLEDPGSGLKDITPSSL